MGLLNFRKKNKKINVSKDSLPKLSCDHGSSTATSSSSMSPESYSPVVNSFMTVSSISDVTSGSLLDEILNELPSSKKDSNSSLESEISSTKNIRRSLNLNSHRNHTVVKGSNTKESRVLSSVTLKGPQMKECMNSSDESESDSLSDDSVLTTDDFHTTGPPISWSDSRFSPGFIAKKQKDTTPLIELINRTTTHLHKQQHKEANTKVIVAVDNTDLHNIQKLSGGFAIDRMKERHRQEYRRSIEYTPIIKESRIVQAQRNSNAAAAAAAAAHHHHQSQAYRPPMQQQHQEPYHHQQQQQRPYHQQINVTSINKLEQPRNYQQQLNPTRSFSSNTNSQFIPQNYGNLSENKPDVTMKQNIRYYNDNKYPNAANTFSGYNRSSQHMAAQQVFNPINKKAPHQYISGVPPVVVTAENRVRRPAASTLRHHSSPVVPIMQEEQPVQLNGGTVQTRMKTTPIMRKEYRRMKQIRKKYYSVPNLQQLQGNEKKLEKKKMSSGGRKTNDDNDKINSQENQQHYNNKFIYRYTHHHHHSPNTVVVVQPQAPAPQKPMDQQVIYGNHQVKTRQPKPLLLLAPFEPFDAAKKQQTSSRADSPLKKLF